MWLLTQASVLLAMAAVMAPSLAQQWHVCLQLDWDEAMDPPEYLHATAVMAVMAMPCSKVLSFLFDVGVLN